MPTTKIKMLALCITGNCNFACKYCYASELNHDLYMTRDIVDKAISLAAGHQERFILQITGGEPLLNKPLLKYIVNKVKRENLPAVIQLQTNCSLMDNDTAKFLYENKVAIGISLDGRPQINDQLRLLKNGKGATNDILHGLEILKNNNISAGLTCVVTDVNVKYLDGLVEFAYYLGNIRLIGFDLLRAQGRGCLLNPPDEHELLSSLEKVKLKHTLLHKLTGINIKIAQRERAQIQLGNNDKSNFNHCYAVKGEAAFVAADGKIYACSSFIGNDEFYLGDVYSGIDEEKVTMLRDRIKKSMHFCTECKDFDVCGGGCFARWYGSGCQNEYKAECCLKKFFYYMG